MKITNQITMDLMHWKRQTPVDVVQDDRCCRAVEVTLTAGGQPWEIPGDVSVVIRYRKPDGTGGMYDTLPDGSRAWSAAGNLLTLELAPQVLTVAGSVGMTVSLIREEIQISTFLILLTVHGTSDWIQEASSDYVHVTRFLPCPAGAEVGQFLRIRKVDDQGIVSELESVEIKHIHDAVAYSVQTLTQEQCAQARKNIGAMSESVLPVITGADEGKLLQVVGGEWSVLPVADSSVKTYVDDYISSALEGEY